MKNGTKVSPSLRAHHPGPRGVPQPHVLGPHGRHRHHGGLQRGSPHPPGFYELRAKGGAAAVTASELVVHPATDASHMFHLDLRTPGNLASWTFLADAIQRHGAVPSVELSHSGQYAGTYLIDKDKSRA